MIKPAGDFSASSQVISVPGGTTQAPGRAVIATRTLAGGATAIIQRWSAKVIDAGNSDQIYFSIQRNGAALEIGKERVPGIEFDFQSQLEINSSVYSGEISIVAFNISGMSATIEPTALGAPVAIRCQAWWAGILLSERGGY